MIDLHVHTSVSDGTVSPTEMVRQAKEIGLNAVAITDHDSIDGHKEAQDEAERLGVKLVKGIEFSASYGDGRLIHILGLNIEPDCPGFMIPYLAYRKLRSEKLDHVFKTLQERGLDISPEALEPYKQGQYLDRQAMAKWLLNNGHSDTMKGTWVDWLDQIPYAEGELIDPQVAIVAIHAAGGKAFMAHFHLPIGLDTYTENESKKRLAELKAMGLDGLEYYYPSYTIADQEKCLTYIREFDFLISGGTDFHGGNRAHIQLGIGEGDFVVHDELLEQF
jgi:predicted metal-dependent phosphoesterase TrpH